MKDDLIIQLRTHSARDLIYRWFAYFEGETESLSTHLDMFTKDVRLIHGGFHLLAAGRESMVQWFANLPDHTSSHFVKSIEIVPMVGSLYEINLMVAFQKISEDFLTSGSVISYKIYAVFDGQNQAQFRHIHKAPIFSNPENKFRDSFSENRMLSFLEHFQYLLLSRRGIELYRLLNSNSSHASLGTLLKEVGEVKPGDIIINEAHPESGKVVLSFRISDYTKNAELKLVEDGGRYMKFVVWEIS